MNDLVPPTGRPLLIVDDDPTFARVLGRALTSRGFEVITSDNADDARTLAQKVVDLPRAEERNSLVHVDADDLAQ